MSRTGTLVLCAFELEYNGYNQVMLNLLKGGLHGGNLVVISKRPGPMASCFAEHGASVRVGNPLSIVEELGQVFCVIANCMMTADVVLEMTRRGLPTIWILHEWWPTEAVIEDQLRKRRCSTVSVGVIKEAMASPAKIVCVCHGQKELYGLTDAAVVFNGTPRPILRRDTGVQFMDGSSVDSMRCSARPLTFLCAGSVGPRKNQLQAVKLFKMFAAGKGDSVRLLIVGARYTRPHEVEYVEKLGSAIGEDDRIELHDATKDMDRFYRQADVLLSTSTSEVTPMVISEALSRSIPVVSSDVGGIGEMLADGKEGFLFAPCDEKKAVRGMEHIYTDLASRQEMKTSARQRYEKMFKLETMVGGYRALLRQASKPLILLDMDGVLVDWDKGFRQQWGERCPIDRSRSYYMEDCLVSELSRREEAIDVMHSKGFFRNLEPMPGAVEAVEDMQKEGYEVYICTSPLVDSSFCMQEKAEWVREHFGAGMVSKVILTQNKMLVVGDVLVDDKPYATLPVTGWRVQPSWTQVLFDAPYNRVAGVEATKRMNGWEDWRACIQSLT